jgi:hypothetical protein
MPHMWARRRCGERTATRDELSSTVICLDLPGSGAARAAGEAPPHTMNGQRTGRDPAGEPKAAAWQPTATRYRRAKCTRGAHRPQRRYG